MITYAQLISIDFDITENVIHSQGGENGLETRQGAFKFGHTYYLLDIDVDSRQETGLLLLLDDNGKEVWANIQDFELDD